MTVMFLAGMLVKETKVKIRSHETKKVLWRGTAGEATFGAEVKDWDFSSDHTIYISERSGK